MSRLWRLIAIGFFAMVALGEKHHIVKTIVHASYFPGAITAIPFVIFGGLVLGALVREFRNTADEKLAPDGGWGHAQNNGS